MTFHWSKTETKLTNPSQEAIDKLFSESWEDEWDRRMALEAYAEASHEVTWPEAFLKAFTIFCVTTAIVIICALLVIY